MPKYTITGSEKQMHCIKEACETQLRLELGQFWPICDALVHDLYDQDYQLLAEKIRELERIVSNMPRKNKRKSDYAEMSWDIYQVIRHRLAWDRAVREGIVKEGESRKWPEMMTVDYDEPVHKSIEPLMLIEKA